MRQATVGPWFWVLTVDIGHVSLSLEHRLFPPSRALGYVKDWTPPTSRENCKGRKHLHAYLWLTILKGTSAQRGFVFLCEALEGPGMGKVILTKYILRLRAWRVLCSASARGQQTSRLRPFPDCCQPPCRSPCKAATAHLQFTKADCRPDEKCPGSSLCWKYALWSPPKLMSSFLWEQLQDWSWMNLESCCSGRTVALAIEPVKTPHFGP